MRRPGRRSGGTGPQPRTVVGRWLRALLLHDDRERDRLVRQLNRGKAGWSKDEAGVMQAACDLAVLQYFGSDYDVRQISEAVPLMRDAELAGGKTPHGQLEMENQPAVPGQQRRWRHREEFRPAPARDQ